MDDAQQVKVGTTSKLVPCIWTTCEKFSASPSVELNLGKFDCFEWKVFLWAVCKSDSSFVAVELDE